MNVVHSKSSFQGKRPKTCKTSQRGFQTHGLKKKSYFMLWQPTSSSHSTWQQKSEKSNRCDRHYPFIPQDQECRWCVSTTREVSALRRRRALGFSAPAVEELLTTNHENRYKWQPQPVILRCRTNLQQKFFLCLSYVLTLLWFNYRILKPWEFCFHGSFHFVFCFLFVQNLFFSFTSSYLFTNSSLWTHPSLKSGAWFAVNGHLHTDSHKRVSNISLLKN